MKNWKFSVCDDFFDDPARKNADDLGAVEICAHGGEYNHDFYIWLDFAVPGLDYDIYAANSTVTDDEAEELEKAISRELCYLFRREGHKAYEKEDSGLFNGVEGASYSPLSSGEQRRMEELVYSFFDGNEYKAASATPGAGSFKNVLDNNDSPINYEAAENLMDWDLCDEVNNEVETYSQQEYIDKYAAAHSEKFNEDFAPWSGGAW